MLRISRVRNELITCETDSIGKVINSLIDAGLHIDYLHEFDFALRQKFTNVIRGEDGYWRFSPDFNKLLSFPDYIPFAGVKDIPRLCIFELYD